MEEKKSKKTTKSTKLKMTEMVDFAIGGNERGEVNILIMKKLFHHIITKLEIEKEIAFVDRRISINDLKAPDEEDGPEVINAPAIKRPIILNPNHGPDEKNIFKDIREFSDCGFNRRMELSCISIGSVFKGTTVLETNTKDLLELPEQYNLIRLLNPHENLTPTLLSETWRMMFIIRQIFQNESDLSKVNLTFEEYREKMKELKAFNDEIRKGINELTKGNTDDTGRTIYVDPFTAVRTVLTKVNLVLELFPSYTEALQKAWLQIGSGTLPSSNFFDNTPSFCGIESLINNTIFCFAPYDQRKKRADAVPTKSLMGIFLKLAQMIKYNDEKHRRLKAIEVQLDNLRLKNATKKEVQKLIERMAEVDGIGNATERLLCRVQKCEDLLCYLRQVVNKIYGCLTANPTTRYESEHIWACLLNPEENKPIDESSENVVSEGQMKNFQTQITKIDCEANIIDKNLMSVETVKVDVKNLFSIVNELEDNKLDKCLLISELTRKAERKLVDEKVSQFCFTSTSENINSVINEILYKIVENDKESRKIIVYLTAKVNSKSNMEDYLSLKEQAENKLRCLARKLITLHKFRTNNNLNNSLKGNPTANKNINASYTLTSSKTANLRGKKLVFRGTKKSGTSSNNNNNNNEKKDSNRNNNNENADTNVETSSCGEEDTCGSSNEYENESDDGENFDESLQLLSEASEELAPSGDETPNSKEEIISDEFNCNNLNNNLSDLDIDSLCVEKNGRFELNTKNPKLCMSLNAILANLNYINTHIGDICTYKDARDNKYINEKLCAEETMEEVRKTQKNDKERNEKVETTKCGLTTKQYEPVHMKAEEVPKEEGMNRGEKRDFMFHLLSQTYNDVNCKGKDFRTNQSIDEILHQINDMKLGEVGRD